MAISSIGDQARAFAFRAATGRLKTSLHVLSQELSTGQVADLGQRLSGNSKTLHSIEARLKMTEQYQRNAAEAAAITGAMQEVFEGTLSLASDLSISLLAEPTAPTSDLLAVRAEEVALAFATVVSRLNGAVAGQHLFSGLHTDQSPLISADAMLDQLEVATAGLSTAVDIAQVVSDWFDAAPGGGGFLDVAYRGTIGDSRQIKVASDSVIGFSTDAASPALRQLMKGLATTALVDRGVLSGQHSERRVLMTTGAHLLIDNDTRLISEMSRIGLSQQMIGQAQARNATSLSILQTGRNEIRQADAYETSAALKEVEGQLSTIYAVAARLSDLKLVEYLR